jgi:hypothetical protein
MIFLLMTILLENPAVRCATRVELTYCLSKLYELHSNTTICEHTLIVSLYRAWCQECVKVVSKPILNFTYLLLRTL